MQLLGQRLLPLGIDMDTDFLYLKSDKAYFLKGITQGWTINKGNGQNELTLKPEESNVLYCSVPLPAGKNKLIGYYYYSEANEGYSIVFNSNGDHLIYRIRGIDMTAEIVYKFCNGFKGITNKPRDFFSEGRIAMKSLCRFIPGGGKELYKELYLVNKKVDNLRIVVEDSIATNSFTTPFFTTTDTCCGDRCRIVKVGVPTPMGEIKIIPIPATKADKAKQNALLFKKFQFRFVDENAWGQRSEHGLISDEYINNLAGCSIDAGNLPHCLWLETKAPCPEIVKRTIEVSSCDLKGDIIGTDGNIFSPWKEAFHIYLYDMEDTNLKWYERSYDTANTQFQFFNDGKSMRIKFCNNRECRPIALADIRNQNPAPITSGSVASIGKGLLYADNENGLGKISKKDIKSIELSLVPTVSCEIKYSRIVVWAVVHNYSVNVNQSIYLHGSIIGFGGFGDVLFSGLREYVINATDVEQGFASNGGYGQRFPAGVEGFRARLAGTQYTSESKQYLWTPSDLTELGYLDRPDVPAYMAGITSYAGKLILQKFDFGLVPNGNYLFEINGHSDTDNIENTSTFYKDTTSWTGYKTTQLVISNEQKQIPISTVTGVDYDSMVDDKIAVIQDVTYPGHNGFCVRGYLKEDKIVKRPIELAEVHRSRNGGGQVAITDHNGFYWWTTQYGEDYKIQLYGPVKCIYNQLLGETPVKKNRGTTFASDVYATTKFPNYAKDVCNRYYITGKVTECVTGGGIEGIAVVLGRTKPVNTNSQGEFKVVAHYANGRGSDQLIFSLGGNCLIVDCNCGPINIVINTAQPTCINCTELLIPIGNFSLKTVVNIGAPHGSRIQIGMIGEDWLGRMTDIQTDETLFVDFPTEQEQKSASYSLLKVKLPANFSADLCSRFKNITFWWSKNTNYEDFFEWAADQVDFIDSAGNKTITNPTKVKIWYRSLNKYNVLRGLNTNTTWSILDTAGNARVGDIVEFVQNIDGSYLPVNTTGNVQHNKEGSYFLVDYNDGLKDVKDGVKFKFKRPYLCETNKTFYEYPLPINFCKGDCVPRDDSGNPVTEFIMNIVASYTLPRQIPVVKDVIIQVPATGGGTQDLITQVTNIILYPYTFEHHSPSDTWGDHCHNGGRVSYINPYEGKKCDRNQMLLTGALNQANDGAINYLHYFSLADEYVIDEQGWGGIQAVLVRDDGQILIICEHTCFSLRSNDDRATVDESGYVRLPTNARFSKPERNPSFNYGVSSNDLNTIRRIDSLVVFLDSNKHAFVLHDFNNAKDISDGIKSWLTPSIKQVRSIPDAMYWHVAIDSRTEKIFLTKFRLDTEKYVNEEIEKRIELNETVSYSYKENIWKQMEHFTPEYFGNMNGDLLDLQFFSFKDGLPYSHHNAVSPGDVFLNYFGIQCVPVIAIVTNTGQQEEKSFVSNEVYCKQQLFILERVETSMGQKSKTYSGQWEFGVGISYAPYLCDTEGEDNCNPDIQDKLMDSDSLWGQWLSALYIPNPGYKGGFFSLSTIISYFYNR